MRTRVSGGAAGALGADAALESVVPAGLAGAEGGAQASVRHSAARPARPAATPRRWLLQAVRSMCPPLRDQGWCVRLTSSTLHPSAHNPPKHVASDRLKV